MKKKILVSLIIAGLFTLVGCGHSNDNASKAKETSKQEQTQISEKWQPEELAEFNKVYRDSTDKNSDGSYPIINVSGMEKNESSITVNCFAPSYQLLKYSLDKFMAIDVKDKEGNSLEVKNIGIDTADNENGKIVVSGDFNKAKYIEIAPYNTSKENFVLFEIK
ncbi:hypothetical protein D2A34_21990 [Clostridium chromiireducens]|uniref:Lipoprotein n=1 Tax=Clostridium chromiireducens TaxID=225345 RepID=A0A399IKR6_9CLOT|nr:hypothetical protein [Clostridium chromiireducens]RII32869.1 hypothetical protein D2A34_21990 [Clostridium chromiireducens]